MHSSTTPQRPYQTTFLPTWTTSHWLARGAKGQGESSSLHVHRLSDHVYDSPEDQAVLEAAYKRDPKPDKTARLELVKQVTLGEKEVQVSLMRESHRRTSSRPLTVTLSDLVPEPTTELQAQVKTTSSA